MRETNIIEETCEDFVSRLVRPDKFTTFLQEEISPYNFFIIRCQRSLSGSSHNPAAPEEISAPIRDLDPEQKATAARKIIITNIVEQTLETHLERPELGSATLANYLEASALVHTGLQQLAEPITSSLAIAIRASIAAEPSASSAKSGTINRSNIMQR